MMMWTDDPVKDAERYAQEQEEEMKNRPVCCECEEPIVEDFYYEVAGEIYCDSCMDKHLIWM